MLLTSLGLFGQNLLEDVDGLIGDLQVVGCRHSRALHSAQAQWPGRSLPWAAWDRARWPSGSARWPLRSERSCRRRLPCSTDRGPRAGCSRSWQSTMPVKVTASAQKRAVPFMFVSFSFRRRPRGPRLEYFQQPAAAGTYRNQAKKIVLFLAPGSSVSRTQRLARYWPA